MEKLYLVPLINLLFLTFTNSYSLAKTPGVPIFDASGNNFIEHIPYNLPIIILSPQGGTTQAPILTDTSHGVNDFPVFTYSANSYDTSDPDPTPILTDGISGGSYTSTPSGLSINSSTGTIDVSDSKVGNYAITYAVGKQKSGESTRYRKTTFNIEIKSATLPTNNSEKVSFNIFPNPTRGISYFSSNKTISKAEVYNVLGKLTANFELDAKEGELNLSELSTGMYMVSFYDTEGEEIVSKRLVKH